MPWDDIKKKSEENGNESPDIVLARIDERVKNLNEKFIVFYTDFQDHKVDDKKDFDGLYKLVWAGGGIISFISFMIMVFKH